MYFGMLALGGDFQWCNNSTGSLATQSVHLGHAAGNNNVWQAVSGDLGSRGSIEKNLVDQHIDASGLRIFSASI